MLKEKECWSRIFRLFVDARPWFHTFSLQSVIRSSAFQHKPCDHDMGGLLVLSL